MVARTRTKRREAQLAPAELERLLGPYQESDPPQTKNERRRIRKLKVKLYGREAVGQHVTAVVLDEDPNLAGGHVAGICCSHRWAHDAWEAGTQYPPGDNHTLMKRCPRCTSMVPPTYLTSSGACVDCMYESDAQLYSRMQASGCVLDFHRLRDRH